MWNMKRTGKDINLLDCLNLFNSEEILDGDNEWYCNKCKEHVNAVKKMDIYKSIAKKLILLYNELD